MNPFDIAEQASIETSRAQRQALEDLNACLLDMDVRALMLDPDPEYRRAVKLRLVVNNLSEAR